MANPQNKINNNRILLLLVQGYFTAEMPSEHRKTLDPHWIPKATIWPLLYGVPSLTQLKTILHPTVGPNLRFLQHFL